MANVSYLRTAGSEQRTGRRRFGWPAAWPSPSPGGRYLIAGLLAAVVAVVATTIVLVSSGASLSADENALAVVGMPMGGGHIDRVMVTAGSTSHAVPVVVREHQIWPRRLIPAHQPVSIAVVVKRPGWISWLTGSNETVRRTMITPSAQLQNHYLTLRAGAPITLTFRDPIQVISYGASATLHRRVLAAPRTEVELARPGVAGSLWVAAAPRRWESAAPTVVSWFPAGAATSAVASPAPGSALRPTTPITLTFSKPVSQALGSTRPPLSPRTTGSWHLVNPHAIVFRPEGFGYGLGTKVSIGLPSGVQLVGGRAGVASWPVPPGSTLRLQQLLADLGYLPLRFDGARLASTAVAQATAAVTPPQGHFAWAYRNIPPALRDHWAPGVSGVMTKGALMAFQNEHHMVTDGVAGSAVWRELIAAALAGKRSSFGYTFVIVHKNSSPQSLALWHDGHTVLRAPVNTGIASAPTASGTYPVFEHLPVTTMSGTNPDGSHYSDPGIQYVSYFNGGDALHAFTRDQFGYPQSLGCVEMPLESAARVYPYTPIGTLVHVD